MDILRRVASVIVVAVTASVAAADDDLRCPVVASVLDPARAQRTVEFLHSLAEPLPVLARAGFVDTLRMPSAAMAPTLVGRYKEFRCPKCGCAYAVSAGSEVYPGSGVFRGPDDLVIGGVCPMCRYAPPLRTQSPMQKLYRMLADDVRWRHPERVSATLGSLLAVDKLAYRLISPRRWDVVVVQAPGDRKLTDVLRIVGLPGETIRIQHGDLFVQRPGQTRFEILRRSPDQVRAMLRPVYDNDYTLPVLIHWHWPARWQRWPRVASEAGGAWTTEDDSRTFSIDAAAGRTAWLRYRHFIPSERDWARLARGPLSADVNPAPQLITDFDAGNTARDRAGAMTGQTPDAASVGLHWVGDLAVQCTLEVRKPAGQAIIELVKGGRQFHTIDLATGKTLLSIDAQPKYRPTAKTKVCGPGTYDVLLANVDNQLLLWIDHSLVRFDAPTTYEPLDNDRPREADLAPIGIGAQGASLHVSRLNVFRDLYHIAGGPEPSPLLCDYPEGVLACDRMTADAMTAFLSDPRKWGVFEKLHQNQFQTPADRYLVLGDNGARAHDARIWRWEGLPCCVSCKAMEGRVMCVCFPYFSWVP